MLASIPARGVSALTHDDTVSYTPPAAFGPFRVLHQIGIGVLGPVFRTYEPVRDRLVSVKAFRIDLLPEQAESLAQTLKGLVDVDLDDPAIVRPLAAGIEGHTVYLAEEYVAAESLDVALKHYAPAPLERALPFLGQVAGAIDFARKRGVGHGALHPRDIFVTPELARATGFGIVQALERLGVRAPVRRPYSAPERVAGAAWSTPADVFALAVVAHELLTGRRPAGTGEVAAITGEAAESNPELLRAVLTRALGEDPDARYRTAGAFVAALEAAAQGRGDESAAVAPSRPESVEGFSPAGARELSIELDRDVAPIAEAGELDLRASEEETAYGLAPIDAFEGRPEAEPTGFAEGDHQEEATEEASVRRHHPRRPPIEEVAAAEPALFDLAAAESLRPEAEEAAPPSPLEAGFSRPVPGPFEEAPQDEEEAALQERFEEQPREELPLEDRVPLTGVAMERSRPAILPYAIVAMVALLAGFLAGYGLGSRERSLAPGATRQADAPAPAPVAPAPAPDAPAQREWSESRVEPPPPAEAPPPVAEKPPSRLQEPPRRPAPVPRAEASKTAPPVAPAEGAGTLIADSRPTGARVVLDGKAVGKTPLKLANVRAGAHSVRLELDGYRVWVSEIVVTGGRDTRVAGSLERVQK